MATLVRTKKIVTIFGPSGAGKKTIAIKLAHQLAEHNRNNNILVIFASKTSAIPLVVRDSNPSISIGKLLNSNIETEAITDLQLYESIQYGHNSKIGYLGYAMGELYTKYQAYSSPISNKLLDRYLSSSYIDYIIAVCDTDIETSILSQSMLRKATSRFLVVNPNIKSLEYVNTYVKQRKVIQKDDFSYEIIINNYLPNDATDAMRVRLGGGNFRIAHDENIYLQSIQGELHKPLPLLNKICKRNVSTLMSIVSSIDYVKSEDSVREGEKIILERKVESTPLVNIGKGENE